MYFPHPGCYFIGSGAPAVNQFLPADIFAIPNRQGVLAQEILIVQPKLFSLSSVFFEVPDAWLPSAMF